MNAALARLIGLTAVWAGVELLERVAFRAGVFDGAGAALDALDDLADDLEPADVSDVVAAHADCCGLPA